MFIRDICLSMVLKTDPICRWQSFLSRRVVRNLMKLNFRRMLLVVEFANAAWLSVCSKGTLKRITRAANATHTFHCHFKIKHVNFTRISAILSISSFYDWLFEFIRYNMKTKKRLTNGYYSFLRSRWNFARISNTWLSN